MIRRLLLSLLLLTGMVYSYAQAPVAQFTANFTSGCAPLTVTFTDQSSNSPKFWNWDFGNGQLSNLQNPSISFGTPGTYTVTLVARNNDGTNGITRTDYITVFPSPQANFTVDKTVACLPATVQFSDLSVPNAGTITAWNWDFGDGTTSTQQNPPHTYTVAGFYTVTLRVTSSTGCQNSYSIGRVVRVVPGVIPEFSFTNPGTCRGPFNVPFKNLTSGPGTLTYQWDFGNATNSTDADPIAAYAAGGTFTVGLTATSEYGCSASLQKQVTINGPNTDYTAPDTVCLGTTVNFVNASSPVPKSTTWDFGNGSTSVKLSDASTYPTAGNYTVRMINVYDECKDSAIKPLVVMDVPVVDFTAPVTTACKGPLTVNFQDASPNAVNWEWDFGDGSPKGTGATPAHTYNAEGSYNVTLKITTRQGCTNSVTKNAFVRIVAPTVAFSNAPAGNCAIFNFAPAANVTTLDAVTNYFWEYGDAGFTANSGTIPNGPSHPYNVGRYTIKVTVTTSGGCTASQELVDGVVVGTAPTANFSFVQSSLCASDSVDFKDLSTPSPGVNEWLWDFGDGTTSAEQNPRHGFSKAGPLTVSLTAYNNRCPSAASTQIVTINAPIAAFTHTVSCPNTVNFTDNSITDAALGAIMYAWDFGDGSPVSATVGNTAHTYAPGTYTAKLTITNGTCSFTYSEQIKITGATADVTPDKTSACKNEWVYATSTTDPANVTKYEWKYDNGNFFESVQKIQVQWPDAGPHTITLRVTDVNGCQITSAPINITITGPQAGFTPNVKGGCANTTVTFADASTSANGIQNWAFDFGDGKTQTFTGAPFTHTYTDTGRFVVKLTIKDKTGAGCPDTYVSTDTIWITKPVAGFKGDYTTICPKTNLPFTDTSAGAGLQYAWDFGDGNTASIANPVHQYAATTGSFTVKLKITDTVGCTDEVTKTNYISVKEPKPAFDAKDTSSICTLMETKFTFKGTDYESFYWDFGDGSTSTLQNPNHFYNDYGTYEAKLYLIGYGGCIDSASDTINVYNPFVLTNMNYSPTSSCNAMTVDFALTVPPSSKFTFTFGDGNIDNSQSLAFQHYYAQPAYYAPSMLLQDSLGCQVSIGGPVTLSVIGALPLFGVDKKNFCDSGTVFFTDYTIGNDPVISHTWDFKDGTTSTDVNPSHKFTTPGTYIVTQTATTQSNCTNSFSDTVRIYATPDPTITSKDVVCIDDMMTLNGGLVSPDSMITWKWNLGSNGQPATQNATVKYGTAGNYTISLEATNKLGCKGETTKTLLVPPTPTATVVGSPTIVVGTGANIPVTYSPNAATYTWTPPTGLSCTDCPVPFANPQFTTKYTVKVEDIYGCTGSQDIVVTVICNAENYFVPNTFSPNGDGNNDVFMPRGKSIARVNRMQVFNRWGELVYEKRNFMVNDASSGWDGTYKGKPANADVYIYLIEFVCNNSSIVPFRGNVTLIR